MQKIFIFLTALLILSGCSSMPGMPPQNTLHWAQAVNVNSNLYRIDDKLYRSEQLQTADYPLLQSLQINTLINLRFFDRSDDRQAFQHTDLHLVNAPLLTWAITPKEVAKVLWQIEQNQQNGAVLIHCYHGADRTGLVSAMYRIVYQDWSAQEAKREMIEDPYGFHSLWKNIENFFTENNIESVKKELILLRKRKIPHKG